jgi:hypothetical protein
MKKEDITNTFIHLTNVAIQKHAPGFDATKVCAAWLALAAAACGLVRCLGCAGRGQVATSQAPRCA